MFDTSTASGRPCFEHDGYPSGACDFEEYRRYYMEYVTKAAVDRGLLPVYWDNGGRGSGGENFGLFDRSNNTVLRPQLVEAMMRAATQSYSLDAVKKPEVAK